MFAPTRRGPALVAFLSLCLLFSGPLLAAELTGDLPQVLRDAEPDELIPVSIVLADQLTGPALTSRATGIEDPGARRAALVAALKQHANATQADVLYVLRQGETEDRAARIRPLWLSNVIGADLTPALIERLAERPEIARINWNPKRDVSLDAKTTPAPPRLDAPWLSESILDLAPGFGETDAEIECGVDLMRAPLVWDELGNTGGGAVVAVIDSGVCWTHSDIINQIWVNPGEDLDGDGVVMDEDDENGVDDDGNGFVDDLIGWNFEVGTNYPNDTNSHGSHCAGTVAGDGTAGHQSGMAPDAQIMVVKVGLTFSDEVDVWNAMQYASENAADAISMSLGWPHNQNPDRATWRTNADNAIDLGTAMVIAAGNEGQGNEPDNVRTPGDVPRVITVGATDCSDNIASFSSRGPVTWQDVPPFNDHPWPPGLIKPDVSAPGVSTRSHSTCSGYSNKSGTSMATPHVAGAVALMVSSNPGLTHDDIKLLLEDTSIDLGDPGKDNVFGTGRVDAYEAVLSAATPDGRVSIRQAKVSCSATLNLTVSDLDLKGTGSVNIEVHSDTESTPEVVTLLETTPTSAVFRGELPVAEGEPAGDGVLQVAGGDLIVATYIDADDGMGGINVEKTDTSLVDCTKPVISRVRETNVGLSAATIRWDTDEASDSVVRYGETVPPDLEERGAAGVTEHSVRLDGLEECTIYWYEVSSSDPQGNEAVDTNGGNYYYFETLGDFGNGPVSCHAGTVIIGDGVYSCSDTVTFELSDLDLNPDPETVQTAVVTVTSSTETEPELVVVTETGPNTSTFSGSIATASGAPVNDGVLQLAEGDVITVTYSDDDDGTGKPGLSFDTAAADCVAPRVTDVEVDTIRDQRATVRWTTDEPSTTRLEWGVTPMLGQVVESSSLKTSHQVMLNDLEGCGQVFFRISGADEYGYEVVADDGGTPFHFFTYQIPGLYWHDDFESGSTWNLEGEWEIGAAEGQGGSSGRADPSEAYNNGGVLGHDLTGLGPHPGDYEPNTNESAWSPTFDATTWTNTKLIYYRQLHSGRGDDAMLRVWVGPGYTLYRSEEELVNDSSWVKQEVDLSGLVDGKPTVQFEFLQKADGSGQYSGWTIDDVIVKNGTSADYAACATCTEGPSFAGATSASDDDACGATGVFVSWEPAVSWGTGGGGTYAVYRGTTPDFVPGSGNLVASGVTGTSYLDESAPTDQQLYYIVRAESDESCGIGPHNGGAMDDNAVAVGVSETTDRAVPGGMSGVELTLVGRAHVRLEWPVHADAHAYRVYRSESPDGEFQLVAETSDTVYEDLDAGGNKANYFYQVRAINACGDEGP